MKDKQDDVSTSRRRFIRNAGAAAVVASPLGAIANTVVNGVTYADGEGVTFADGPRPIVNNFPGKKDMILVHSRPPHLETPFENFNKSLITSNEEFFVRYHLADIPTSIDPDTYTLSIKGLVDKPITLSLSELKAMAEPTEIVAVQQCTGNSRGYSSPRVFGAQLGNGAMGNARFVGIPLKTVLEKAGVKKGAQQVTFNGLDKPVLDTTPDFRKALPIDHAMSGEPMIVWEMNGEPLPFLNGFPIKLIVPGYFATYWVKHLSEIEVIDHTFSGFNAFFMTHGYRIPDNDCGCVEPGTKPDKTRPVTRFPVRSFITSIMTGGSLPVDETVELKGIAFDSGTGIKSVAVSTDGGDTWQDTTLDEDLGRFSFRGWRLAVKFKKKGRTQLMVRALANSGETQPMRATWNPGGYLRNVVEVTHITIA